MNYVIGIDLGTSSVKTMLVDRSGNVCYEASESYPLIYEQSGYSEQHPEDWVEKTELALHKLLTESNVVGEAIEGISFSGQMHGLVLLNKDGQVLRNAILWNDLRTTKQCRDIEAVLGDKLLEVAKNAALEGFTLPKLLWVKEHEPELFHQAAIFLLPKDYLRFRMTGHISTEYSDAAGTLLLDIVEKQWSSDICDATGIDMGLCPPLVESHSFVGTLLPDFASRTGLKPTTKVFAGGADNACGAIGAGILSNGKTLCSIGTSGVILAYEDNKQLDVSGKSHFFNHAKQDSYYAMGVTLAAGYSLQWFRDTFAPGVPFNELLEGIDKMPIGSKGLLFTPYLVGERTPHSDATIRASFIGMDGSHTRDHLVRSVVEGITFSLRESVDILRLAGKRIDMLISIGGGSKNETWLQMQADVFNTNVIRLESEQGPAMGAAILAAVGCGWFDSLEECAEVFLKPAQTYLPIPANVERYEQLYRLYQCIYDRTKQLCDELSCFR
ncbi:xylulokinase [Paenibacillus sp. SYP-B3998]|uniref:Xylulose kinase n=1 Tax=Paenibacillus sp. SYP-B3998 TaxID=2678564 RepID=A0A6G4A4C4_9BACL|nr:xylulokinase [Paenibacillus sp. SYP-B3998]NEW09180.1 xylulokinase [Paenibacillus sp. SYP-B3998]